MEVFLLSKNIPAMHIKNNEIEKHIAFTFLIDGISRACSHQLVRHRLASYSQQSQRYVSMRKFPFIKPDTIKGKKLIFTIGNSSFNLDYKQLMDIIGQSYESLIEQNTPREDARFVLPNSCETRIVFTMNGREIIRFLKLRTCNRAQWEIKEMAIKILQKVREEAPEIFNHIGPACFSDGFCPEGKKSCGEKDKVIKYFGSL